MNTLSIMRVGVWVVPLVLIYVLVMTRPRSRSLTAAVVLTFAWNAWSLLGVNLAALSLGWWSFHPSAPTFMGVALEPWLGWTLLWTAVALLAPYRPLGSLAIAVAWLDLVVMPALEPLVVLGDGWLWGEVSALAVAFGPGLLLSRWTILGTHLRGRLYLQIVCAAGVFVWLVLSAAFETHGGWGAVLALPGRQLGLVIQAIGLPAVLGWRAAIEFAERGGGTPLPYDSPERLVTSGPYAYVRNPMQLSMVLVYLTAAVVLWNWWLLVAGVVSFCYGAGLAEWHEDVQLSERYGRSWTGYRTSVRAWLPTWRPRVVEESTLLVAYSCGTCSSIGRWFQARGPVGLKIAPAEEANDPELRRVTYLPAEGSPARGVIAIARALEHIHLGWASVGWILALPVVSHFAQLVADTFGPTPQGVAGRTYDEAACYPRGPFSRVPAPGAPAGDPLATIWRGLATPREKDLPRT